MVEPLVPSLKIKQIIPTQLSCVELIEMTYASFAKKEASKVLTFLNKEFSLKAIKDTNSV